MNGSRANPSRPGDRSSLDALSRTIEGLEARIEGLMNAAREPRQQRATEPREIRRAVEPQPIPAPAPPRIQTPAADALSAIRERQRMLDASRERPLRAASAPQARFADIRPPEAHRPPAAETNAGTTVTATTSPRQSSEGRAASQPDTTVQDIAQALVSLRQDLKKDIADGVAREMNTLRAEIRGIRSMAEDQQFSEDLRGDLARLAESISQLNGKATPEAEGLRAEFEELRTVMDGLAREESVQRMESHWQGFEARLADLDAAAVREELVALAYRIDEIKSQLGAMSDNPMIRTLEQKLIVLAGAMEQLGSRMHPADADLSGQFATLDERLDEISRAIAVNGRASAAALDQNSLQRLEGRIGALADQIETIGRATLDADMAGGLSARIEALAVWVEELASDQSALRLEERLEQLSQVLDQTQKASAQPELASHLADISRKIDGLAQGTINDALAERLDYLAQRIDGLELPRENPQPGHDHPAFGRIEDRLSDIAARLDEAAEAPKGDSEALRGLEAQIAHLSSLFHERQDLAAPLPGEFESRVTTLENYMATSDEYILEAARQAAEAVVDAYSRNAAAGASLAAADITALGGLAEDLRHLQELTRGSEERTHHTFDALHRTLVQIADRLDTMEDRLAAPRARQELPFADAPQREPAQSSPAVLAASRAGLMSSASVSMEREIQAAAPAEDMQAGLQPEGQALEPTADTALAEDADRQAKPSLLTGLSRLLPGNKGEPSKPARTIVDPTPSIDPVDMLPPERENDLLEPGSGAPDVKKILERVRASQAAGEFGGERPISADRADYIAAARRAAKAAAQETDPSQSEPMARLIGKSARQPKEAGLGGAFSRHKRPILMAVGAVLLALMAMPLVKTLTSGEQAPPAIEAPAEPAGNALPEPTDSTVPSMDGTAPDDTDATGEAAPAAEPTDDTASHLTDPQAAEGTPATIDASGAADTQAAGFVAPETTPVVAEAPPAAEAATEAPAPIVVPAGTEPKSLADAAAAGDPGALFEIGVRYTEGRGVGADLSEAANWYKLAADRGYAPAQYRLANLFEKGTGVDRDLGRAMTYYRQAAEAGNASAMHNLAVLYASGPESQPDYATAVEWFRKAADLGVADSQFNLAILYARGNGISQDLEESYKWFAIAAQSGDKDAAAKRDEVAKAMRQEQLESARAKADAWKAQPLDEKANSVNVPAEWAGAKPLTTASVDMEKAIRNIQAILNKSGFDAGAPDGKLGQKTTAAIKAFQTSVGQEPTGRINDALVKELLARNS